MCSRQKFWEAEHKYVVVEFPDEEEGGVTPMAIVSSQWIIEDDDLQTYCLWPTNFKSDSARMKAVEQHLDLKTKTQTCSKNRINIKYSSVIYQNAVLKLKQLENCQSVSESDGEVNKGRLKRRKQLEDFVNDDCSSDEELIPTPPKLHKRLVNQSVLPVSRKTDLNKNMLCSFSKASSPTATISRSSTPLSQAECKGCRKNQDLIADVLKKLDSLKEDIAFLISTNVPKTSDIPRIDIKEIEALQKRTVEDLMDFNNKLNDSNEMVAMLSLLQTVGGKDIFDTTRRIMSRIMSNGVACDFNWTGKHEKAAFCQLKNIKSLITVAVRKNRLCQNATEDEIERAMKTWLRNAPDREGGRSKRKNISG